jgi:hypothetical protein
MMALQTAIKKGEVQDKDNTITIVNSAITRKAQMDLKVQIKSRKAIEGHQGKDTIKRPRTKKIINTEIEEMLVMVLIEDQGLEMTNMEGKNHQGTIPRVKILTNHLDTILI